MGDLTGEELGEETVATVSEYNSEGVRGWGGARGSDIGDDGFTPKIEGQVSGDRAREGSLYGLCGGGKLLNKAECELTSSVTWVQGREGYGDNNRGG